MINFILYIFYCSSFLKRERESKLTFIEHLARISTALIALNASVCLIPNKTPWAKCKAASIAPGQVCRDRHHSGLDLALWGMSAHSII